MKKRSIIRRSNTPNNRHSSAARRGATTIEIGIMVFIAALAALAIYGIAKMIFTEADKQTEEVMKGTPLPGATP